MCKDLNGSEVHVKKIELPNYISPFILKVNNYKNLQQLKKKKIAHLLRDFSIFNPSSLTLIQVGSYTVISVKHFNLCV